jgi:hypothetical protein
MFRTLSKSETTEESTCAHYPERGANEKTQRIRGFGMPDKPTDMLLYSRYFRENALSITACSLQQLSNHPTYSALSCYSKAEHNQASSTYPKPIKIGRYTMVQFPVRVLENSSSLTGCPEISILWFSRSDQAIDLKRTQCRTRMNCDEPLAYSRPGPRQVKFGKTVQAMRLFTTSHQLA